MRKGIDHHTKLHVAKGIDSLRDAYRSIDSQLVRDSHNRRVLLKGLDQAILRAETALERVDRYNALGGHIRL